MLVFEKNVTSCIINSMEKKFKLNSKYKPAGDQPNAIEQLVQGIENGDDTQTLLGITGSGKTIDSKITIGGIELNDKTKQVTVDGEIVNLTRTEYDILKLLMEHPGEVYSPNQIYVKVWNDEPIGTENTVAVHIRHLREKIEIDPAEPRYLKVIWGRGYKMEGE